ncbi:MAG: hypothetical protein GY719_08195 [bacterium]|nr:hypothetical protein [bacterium]
MQHRSDLRRRLRERRHLGLVESFRPEWPRSAKAGAILRSHNGVRLDPEDLEFLNQALRLARPGLRHAADTFLRLEPREAGWPGALATWLSGDTPVGERRRHGCRGDTPAGERR